MSLDAVPQDLPRVFERTRRFPTACPIYILFSNSDVESSQKLHLLRLVALHFCEPAGAVEAAEDHEHAIVVRARQSLDSHAVQERILQTFTVWARPNNNCQLPQSARQILS